MDMTLRLFLLFLKIGMTCFGGGYRCLDGLGVAHFTKQDHIRCLTKRSTKTAIANMSAA